MVPSALRLRSAVPGLEPSKSRIGGEGSHSTCQGRVTGGGVSPRRVPLLGVREHHPGRIVDPIAGEFLSRSCGLRHGVMVMLFLRFLCAIGT